MTTRPDDSPIILYEDLHCLAVVKPAGLLTQARFPNDRSPSLEGLLRRYLWPDDPGSIFLGTVHRLDRPVSGVMIWGKTLKATRRLHQQFADRQAEKQYWAIVAGQPTPVEGIWDDWLYEDDTGLGPIVQICRPDTPRARHAVTRYRLEPTGSRPEGTSWLRLWPRTGRTHQLRAQAGSRDLPILGDTAYGSNRSFPLGIALHARSLRLTHPTLGTPLHFEAPVPEHWAAAGIAP